MRRVILSVLVLALLFALPLAVTGCKGIKPVSSEQLTGVPGQNPNGAADPAKRAICLQNQQTFEQQVATWSTANPDTAVPTSLEQLKAQGVINTLPTCPNGGTLTWDGTSLTCSVDGHAQ